MFNKGQNDVKPFETKVWLSSPTMHGEELQYMTEAFETNWMSTVGANINEAEKGICQKVGCKYAVAISAGTAALHMAMKLAGEDLYGCNRAWKGCIEWTQSDNSIIGTTKRKENSLIR